MDPLALLQNDMSRLIMQSNNIFETWTDKNADAMKTQCVGGMKQAYNNYANEMNTQMRFYMIAQSKIEDAMKRLMKLVD